MSAATPTTHTAGDSFAALLEGSTYPASAGWSASLVLIGQARHTLAAAASGDDHAVAVAGASTATWPPGAYAMRVLYSKAAERHSVCLGALAVAANPADAGTDARALMSLAEQALQDLEAAYRAHLASGNVHVGRYTIAGRSMEYRGLADLLTARSAARRDVVAERAAKRARAGLPARLQLVARM